MAVEPSDLPEFLVGQASVVTLSGDDNDDHHDDNNDDADVLQALARLRVMYLDKIPNTGRAVRAIPDHYPAKLRDDRKMQCCSKNAKDAPMCKLSFLKHDMEPRNDVCSRKEQTKIAQGFHGV